MLKIYNTLSNQKEVFKPIEEEMGKYNNVDSIELPCSDYSLKSLWYNIKAARNAVKKEKYDIVHITGSEHYLLPFLRKYNTVVTVHDLGFYTNKKLGLRTIPKYLFWNSCRANLFHSRVAWFGLFFM